MNARLPSLVLLTLLLTGWEIWVRAAAVPALILPAPSSVLATLWSEIATGRLWPHLGVTTIELLLGFGIGAGAGLAIGVLLAESPALDRLLRPYVLTSQLVPKLALGPLFIIWLGFGLAPTVAITALICFFPVVETTLTGLREVDPGRRELFRMLQASRWQVLTRLALPLALPTILAGIRVAAVLALVGAVVGEFIAGRVGLGASIIAAQSTMDSPLIFALFLVITALGGALYGAVRLLERLVLARYSKG